MTLNPGCTNCVPKKPAQAVDCSFEPTITISGGSIEDRILGKVRSVVGSSTPNGGKGDNGGTFSEACVNKIRAFNKGNPHGFNYNSKLCGTSCNQLIGQNIDITWTWKIKVSIQATAVGSATLSCSCLDCGCEDCGDCSSVGNETRKDSKNFTVTAKQTQSFRIEADAVPGLINLPDNVGGKQNGGRNGGKNPGGKKGGNNKGPGGKPGSGGKGNKIVAQSCFFRKQGGTPDPVIDIPDIDFNALGKEAAAAAFNKALGAKGACNGPDNCAEYITGGSASGTVSVNITTTAT
jgi:hypothetical protein